MYPVSSKGHRPLCWVRTKSLAFIIDRIEAIKRRTKQQWDDKNTKHSHVCPYTLNWYNSVSTFYLLLWDICLTTWYHKKHSNISARSQDEAVQIRKQIVLSQKIKSFRCASIFHQGFFSPQFGSKEVKLSLQGRRKNKAVTRRHRFSSS